MTTSSNAMSAEKPIRIHEGRKSSKPLMEKRRRARINDCLTELQSILDSLTPENGSSRQSKREKADILEQTVKLVKQLRQQNNRGNPLDPHAQGQFRAGFNECITSVTQFLSANQASLNEPAKAALLSHLADSLQSQKLIAERLPPRRRTDETANSSSPSIKPQTLPSTSSQSEGSSTSLNVVHPMRAPVMVTSAPAQPTTVAGPAGVTNMLPGGMPSLTARLELTSNGGNCSAATRLVPIGIPIKVQSAGQFVLVPSQMLNGGQLTAPFIPVLNPPTPSIAPSPTSSVGSSGSVAVSPISDLQSPHKSPAKSQTAASISSQGAIMYASCPASIGTAANVCTSSIPAATPYPVAFVAMGDHTEGHHHSAQVEPFLYPSRPENLPKLYLPANPPTDTGPVWRPW